MTDFASLDDIAAGLKAAATVGFSQGFGKTAGSTNPVAGRWFSTMAMVGGPASGAMPTSWGTPGAAIAGNLNPGYAGNPGPGTCRILYAEFIPSVANQPIWIVDRIGHMGGMDGTSTATQNTGASLTTPASQGRCNASGDDVRWWIECYTTLGGTAVNATCAVTYSDNSTGSVVVAVPAAFAAGGMLPIYPASGNLTIKSVDSVTLSASTTAVGNFGVTATVFKFPCMATFANELWRGNWERIGLPKVGTDAYLYPIMYGTGTNEGNLLGSMQAGIK